MDKLISACQTTFIKGGNIMDGVMSFHEILHDAKRRRQQGVVLKLDFERHMTRFNPGNAHVCGLSRHGALVGSDELDDDQTKAEGHKVYPGSAPLVG
jgi:hypothetical protein